ncbi:serine/threonine-protein kinase [Pseudonocardia zijingensis]|uniref:Protein kinase domain-containing protein n=1 Tax=Pseudonocardia zijingensis TaxID=153376 RepID=A0ABN1QTN1_9PSEU
MEPIEAGGPEQAGRYQLHGRLGAGATGTVYLGVAPDGVQVAVKVVHPGLARDPQFRARFRREIDLSRRVGGPWVAEVVDADPNAEPPWVATRFVPGPSLDTAVRAGGPFGVDGVRAFGHVLARGVESVHAAGVVHRNLKPSNVLLDATHPRLVDCGFSPAALENPAFTPPEQLAGQEITTAADVFSLGSVLYFATTGRSPSREPDLSALPDPLRAPIAACLATRPQDRPSASEVGRLLEPPHPGPVVALPQPPAQPATPTRYPRRRNWLIGAVAVATVAAVAFTLPAVLSEPAPPAPPPPPPPPSASAETLPPPQVRVITTQPLWEHWGDHVFDPSGEYVHLTFPAGLSTTNGCSPPGVRGTCLEMRSAVGVERSTPMFLEGLASMENSLAIAPDGRRIFLAATTLSENQVHVAVVDPHTRSLTHLIPTGGAPIVPFQSLTHPEALASAPDGTRAALARGDTVTIVDVETSSARPITITGQPAGGVPSYNGPISDIAFTPDGKQILVATDTGLEIIDVDAGRVTSTALGGTAVGVVEVVPDGSRALIATSTDVLTVDLPTVRVAPLARLGEPGELPLTDLAISADGRRAFVTGKSLWVVDTAEGAVTEVQLSGGLGGTFEDVDLSRTRNAGAVLDNDNVYFFEWM